MQPLSITRQYYARWLGVDTSSLDAPGAHWQYNKERNQQPAGYSAPIDVYAYVAQNTVIVSYGDRAKDRIDEVRRGITPGMAADDISGIFEKAFAVPPRHQIKFYLQSRMDHGFTGARRLTDDDYPLYLDFFRAANPNCRDVSWVRDYFTGMAQKGYCHGVVADGRLVSATDAPDIPFMRDVAQEIGINTLPGYQRRGFAQAACLSCVHEMLQKNICSLWSTAATNVSSQKLAARVGFAPLFDNLTLSL